MILIDANVYLRFYSSGESIANLVAVLTRHRAEVFVTRQIADEVLRNRGTMIGRLMQNYSDQLNREVAAKPPQLPSRFLADKAADAEAWNKEAAQLKKSRNALSTRFSELRSYALDAVRLGTDELSKTLAPHFSRAAMPSEAVLQKARDRKERGNPPGKPDDPIGDQLTWEMFLAEVGQRRPSKCYLVSHDEDYFMPHVAGSARELNPMLAREFAEACPNTNIVCLDDLGYLLNSLDGSTVVPTNATTKPTTDVLENFRIPPLTGITPTTLDLSGIPSISASGALMETAPKSCTCGGSLWGVTSTNGGRLSWNLSCSQCGARNISI